MMKKISVSELQQDNYIDAPAYLDEAYILLSPDTPLTDELIERLKRWGYEAVLSDGQIAEAPAHSNTGTAATTASVLDMDIKEKLYMEEAKKLYYSLVNFSLEAFKQFKEENRLNIPRLSERVKLLIDRVKSRLPPGQVVFRY